MTEPRAIVTRHGELTPIAEIIPGVLAAIEARVLAYRASLREASA